MKDATVAGNNVPCPYTSSRVDDTSYLLMADSVRKISISETVCKACLEIPRNNKEDFSKKL